MSRRYETNWEGFQFFGKMSASISHEIKNTLSIINETAGLLEDLVFLAEKGKPLDQERLKTMAQRIMRQVHRADEIVKNLNKFAHSVDRQVKSVDLDETLELVLALSGRFASMRGVTMELEPCSDRVAITTIPFFLNNLLWLCMDFAMKATERGGTVRLIIEQTKNGPRIRFTRLEGLVEAPMDEFQGAWGKALLDMLEAEITADTEAAELILSLQKNIGP